MSPLSDTLKSDKDQSGGENEAARNAAAIMIQRVWRARQNRAQRDYLTPEKRWNDTLVNAQFEVGRHGLHQSVSLKLGRRTGKLRLMERTTPRPGGDERCLW